MPVADPPEACQISSGRYDNARLALNRLDENGGRERRDRLLKGPRVAQWHRDKPGGERPKAAPVGRFAGKAYDRRRSAMEIPRGDDNLRFAGRNRKPVVTITARGLDRGLDRLCAGVHRQARIEPGETRKL